MTNQQGAPEARSYEHQRAIMEGERNASLAAFNHDAHLSRDGERLYETGFTNGWNRLAALVEAQQPAAHVQNPAEIEHVAGDVSKNGPESNMAQQPAPSAVAAEIDGGPPGSGGWEKHAIEMERQRDFYRQRCHTMEEHQNGGVWYWQGDDGDNLESMGNSMLVVIRADQLRALIAAPQPSPTPQADSQPAPLIDAEAVAYNEWFNGEQGTAYDGMWAFARAAWMTRAARAPAASVTAPAGVASMREDFEAYWRSKYAPLPMNTRLHDDGRYGDPTIQQEWESWRATHTPTQPTQAADSVLEDAAPRAAERPTVIPVPGGAELHFEPYLIDSPQTLWRLRRNGVHIRWLNEYEQGFVNAAIDAARKQGGAT